MSEFAQYSPQEDEFEVPELVPVSDTHGPEISLARIALLQPRVEDGVISSHQEEEEEDELPEMVNATVSFDNMKDYLRAIGKTPLLNAEQEVELSMKIEVGLFAHERLDKVLAQGAGENSVEVRELKELMRVGDRAMEHMLSSNLRLVVSIARRYQNRGLTILDLIQEGNLGLIRAVQKFDYTKGFKFSTYATWWIQQSVTRALADKGKEIRLPVHMVEKINKLAKLSRQMLGDLGREPTEDELAREMDLPVEKIREFEKYARSPISLNVKIGDDGEGEFGDLISDQGATNPAENIDIGDREKAVERILANLTDKQAQIIRQRFGLDGKEPMSLDAVGAGLGISRETTRGIQVRAMERLRRLFKSDQALRDYLS